MNSPTLSGVVLTTLVALRSISSSALGDDASHATPAKPPGQAVERALTFLEQDVATWRKDHDCVTCHHGIMTVWAMSEAQSQGYKVNAESLAEFVRWTKDRFAPRDSGPQAPQPGLASIPLLYLGTMSQHLPILSRDELNQVAVHLAARQHDDGTWDSPPPKNGPPPTWESRETVALLALLAWEPSVPADATQADAVRAKRDKTLAWLSATESTGTNQALTLRLLVDVRRGGPEQQLQPAIDRLLARQNSDGGWSQTSDLPSDAYATGQALYALSVAGVKSDRDGIQRAISFLTATLGLVRSAPVVPETPSR